LTLDESTDNDRKVEEKGLTFLLDPFAASFIQNGLTVEYDEAEDDFIVRVNGFTDSNC
jgi:hypothetical protein